MSKVLKSESTLTDRYQTTIPESVREALRLRKRDKICYIVQDDGKVLLSRVNEEDPVLRKFLLFIENDVKINPSHLRNISPDLVKRARALVSKVDVDLDAALPNQDEE